MKQLFYILINLSFVLFILNSCTQEIDGDIIKDTSAIKVEEVVSNELSSEALITEFTLIAKNNKGVDVNAISTDINQETKIITIVFPFGTVLSGLTPSITVSEKATIKDANVSRDFNELVTYEITAEDVSIEKYAINVSALKLSQRQALINMYKATPSTNLDWDITSEDISAWEGVTLENGNVIELNVSNSSFQNKKLNITKDIRNLVFLKKLFVKEENEKLPEEIGRLKQLTELTIFLNLLEFNTPPQWIGGLTSLQSLEINTDPNLTQGRLQLISSPIPGLENLNELKKFRTLYISFEEFPTGLLTNTKLETLDFFLSQVDRIPDEINNLIELKVLRILNDFLGGNPLDFNMNLDNLINLESLTLDNISEFNDNILSLKKLKNLSLSGTSGSNFKIPDGIDQLLELTSLSLQFGNISTTPNSLYKLTKLKSLNLSTNQITAINRSIGLLTNLTSLNLSSNKIPSLSTNIGDLKNLTSLSVNNNQLTSLPKEIGKLLSLKTLNIRSNTNLLNIPASICNLESTGTRIFKDNTTTCSK